MDPSSRPTTTLMVLWRFPTGFPGPRGDRVHDRRRHSPRDTLDLSRTVRTLSSQCLADSTAAKFPPTVGTRYHPGRTRRGPPVQGASPPDAGVWKHAVSPDVCDPDHCAIRHIGTDHRSHRAARRIKSGYGFPRRLQTDGACEVTRGASSFVPPVLQLDTSSAVQATWRNVSTTDVRFGYVGVEEQQLTEALGSRSGERYSRVHLGFTPHDSLPVLLRDHLLDGLPSPPILPVADCVFGTTDPSTFADPPDLRVFPRIAFGHYEEKRTPAGRPALISSVTAAAISSSGTIERISRSGGNSTLTLEGDNHLVADLAGPADGVQLPQSTERVRLVFAFTQGGTPADYTRVRLYRFAGSALVPVRMYTIADPEQRQLVVDRSIFTSGEYVFAIEAHRGRPRVSVGDFAAVRYPQAASRIFTRSFVVP